MQAFTVKFRQLFRTCEVCTMERWRGNKVVAECTLGLGTCVPLCWMQLALQTVALSPEPPRDALWPGDLLGAPWQSPPSEGCTAMAGRWGPARMPSHENTGSES